jgi:hypothetical protein
MKTWDFRILAFVNEHIPEESYFECRTVYYKDGKLQSYGDPAPTLYGSTKKALRWQFNAMKRAMSEPILWGDDKFPKKYKRLKKKV